MTNRKLTFIIKHQKPLALPAAETVATACRSMHQRETGSVLVVDDGGRLVGIFTGRDAVRLIATDDDTSRARLGDAMTNNPKTAPPTCRAIDALRIMTADGFRHLPVIDGDSLLGVVSRRDFKGMELQEFLAAQRSADPCGPDNRTITEIIAGKPTVVLPSTAEARQACRLMHESGAGSALVVDADEQLVGIFTGRDAIRALANATPGSTGLQALMTANPVTVSPRESAIDALRRMSEGGFRHLPVVENGKVVGVLTRSDFTGPELDRLEEEEHLKECIW